MKASARALVLVASGVAAFPSYLSCDRPLVVGHVIMGKAAIEESASATAFEGKECGGTYTPGEELTLAVSGGGTYMLEVVGGALSTSGNKCNSRRYANLGSASASYAMSTSADKSLVEAWIGRGTGPTLADMPVAIFSKCTLTAAPASSTPTPAPSPGTSPTPAPSTSPTESKGGGAPLIVLPSLSSSGLELFVSLTIEQYLLVLPDNLQQYTSGYDGGLTGPTIRVKPGSTLHVKLNNQLSRKTNLHTHGLHVHGRQPGDDVFVGTEPGDSFDYTFEIPPDHMGGTFLYHPHYHGSTAIQAGGGAAGLIIVEDDPSQLPSEIATLPEILTMLSHIDMPHLKSMGIEEEAQCVAKGFSPEECDEPSWSEGPISGTPINYVAVNGMFQPTISMVANRWYRWRMAYMTPLGILRPTIPGCDTKLLAKDGIYLPTAPRDVTIGHMGPGNRADWLVRCPIGTYDFKDQSTRRRLAPNQVPFISLMGTIKVTDEGFTPCDLPTFEVNRPCYLVDLRDSAPNTTVDFTMGPTPYINGAKFESATTYAATMPVGEVIQFDLAGIVLHPFHNHINSFQIVEEPADTSQGYYRAGDWHDTVVGPEYSMSVRFQTDTFTGPQVFHCHELTHEDRGMIGVTLITGTEPTVWAGAKGVDANCVRGTSPLHAATILTEGTCSAVVGPLSTTKSTALSSTSLCYETDCSFMVSFRESPNVADHMEFTVKHTGEAWLGLGVSPDGRMGSEAISIITTWEGALSASHVYRLEGRTKEDITRGWVGLADVISATREEGVSTMVANVPLSDSCTPGELVICRNRPTTIIAARGHFDHLGVHPGQTRITLDTRSLYMQPRALKWDLLLHVISMSLAWLFCAPVALFCARARHINSFKPFLLRTRFKGGRQYWYLVHRNCLITAVTLTTFAGVFMVARTEIHFAVTHSYFGVVTMCLASFQMIDAWLRPKHGHKWRKFWERLHKSLGISVLILAVMSGAFGASALQARVNREFHLTSKIDGQLLQPTHSDTPQPPPSPKLLQPPAFSPVVLPPPVRKSPPISSPPPGPPPLGVKAAVQEAARRIEALCLQDLTTGPKFIRLAFRDAGTYDAARDLYGPRASMRFEPEASYPSNRGLDEARKLLEPIKRAAPVLSYADLWQLAAVVSIEMMGGPRVPFRVGRTDASSPEECAPDGMLSGAHDTAEELRSAFNRMGFNDGELVALMGAHTVGICRVRNSGFRGPWDATSLRFDNLYYREVLKSDRWLYDGSQFNAVNGDGTMLLETDFRMSTDDAFATWTRLFADDELVWFEMFAGAFQKLGELGHASSSLARVDYTLLSVHTGQLQAAVQHAAQLVQVLVEKHRVGPAFVRLAWQDACTYNTTDGKYGPRASMRFEPEASYPSNRGLERIRSMLEPIKQAVPMLSYADLWQLAAVVSIEMMGGPRVPFRVGRIDASSSEECAPAGMLPGAHDTTEELRSLFNRMGFNDGERVALMGAHTLGRCQPQNSGFNGAWTSEPLAFDNQYFKEQFDEQWASAGDSYQNGHQDGTIRLNADMHLSTDPQLVRWATAFASDEALFFSSFTSAFQKMSQLGHTSLRDAPFSLSPISPAITNAQGDSVCLNRERGSCIVLLSWTVHPEDDSATAIVKVAHLVGWVALAVSKEGRMTYPDPSYAIVGSDIGIRKHILQAQDVTSLTRSAPLDSEQRDVREASFERSNGFATLRFRTNLTWFTRDVTASLLAQEQVQNATTMIAKLVATRHVGPAFLRLAWQDAGTFDARQNKYGPRASMRFEPEASYPSNRGVDEARKLLEPIKQAVPELSYADLWQLAAVVSIEMMGGPRVPFRVGRIDASGSEECAPDGMLPSAHDTAEELRSAFNRMGFNDEELVALSGARTLGRCHFQNSGFDGAWTSDPLLFDNKFYTTIRANNVSYVGNKWMSEHGIMLDADLAFKNDSGFRVYTDRFGESETAFFEAFAKAFSKLSDLGWTGLAPSSYTIPTMPVATDGMSGGGIKEVQLGDTTRVSLRVELRVQWLAIAVSAAGKMITPQPSRAVVGTLLHGVYQRSLVAKDMTAISSSAPIDSVQSLTNPTLTQVDGATILAFTVDHSFLTQFADGGSAVNFLFAHGEPDSPASTFGYHGPRRGAMLIQDFDTAAISSPSSPPPSPWLPRSAVRVELTPHAGVSLFVALKDFSSVASIKLVLQRQVPWLSVAVSHSGFMTDPNSSKAVIGDLASSSVSEFNLVSQNPSMPTKSVEKPINKAGVNESSVSFADGVTVLQFDISVAWLTAFGGTEDVWLLWAHGSATLPRRFPSYHAENRGAVLISRDDLFGEYHSPPSNPAPDNSGGDDAPDSKPPPPPQPPDASSCNCGDEVDWCGETEAYNVAKCYVSDVSLTPTTFSTNHSMDYDHEVLLSSEYRMKWKIRGTYPDGEISIILEARTTGWLGFGLMGDPSADGNGMINSDIYLGAVIDGVAYVLDAWSSSVAAPIQDKQFGHTHDIYDIGGFEIAERGMTTIWFTRKLVTNDTWDYNIDPGVGVPIIFAYSRKNVDSFSHYHGPTRGFDQIVFIPSVPPHDYSNLAIAAGVAVAMVLFMLTVDYGKKRMQTAAARAARLAVLTKQIDDSVEGAGKFMFGMVLLKASDFLKHDKFVAYEKLRDANEVKLLDTIAAAHAFAIDKCIIFFSHQWLGWDEPDPNRVHYACMKRAVERVVDESATSLEQTWVWVDYSCMPQLNQTTLGLAVSDLSEVACLATFFVVVAPPTMHQDSRAKCDLISYQARGWCRLEQFSYVCTGKTGSMLVSTGGGEEAFQPYISQPAEWKKQALWVLQGEYTCCSRSKNHTVGDMLCDKDKLKPALLRMYMKAICHLPPCPLREQLLERDFEILDAGSFDDFIVTLARKKTMQRLQKPRTIP
ncbi:hypothetical protein AB1Y20_005027 [Prymnesium parvum]|uniref:Peroxidase n=1 Tax=Prymnesium parvum TaxID=97485 RepID=A0AB34J5C5_PRYPA